jgi:phosphinothricin acetyltransferase
MISFSIRDAEIRDIPRISEIYNQSIPTVATYDIHPEEVDQRYQWFLTLEKEGMPVLVATDCNQHVIGWASLNRFHARAGFRFTLENSLYVCQTARRCGVGRALLHRILQEAESIRAHTIIAKIDSSNHSSIRLHEQAGFQHSGVLRQAGYKFNQWLDVVLMQFFPPPIAKE